MRSIKTVDAGFADQLYQARAVGDELTVYQAYTHTPLRRGIDLVANSAQTLPNQIVRGEETVTEDYELLDQSEAINLALSWGILAGQWYATPRNVGGRTKLDFIHPLNIRPKYDIYGRLEYFERNMPGAAPKHYDPFSGELVWWWEQNFESDRGPGASIAYNALIEANLIRAGELYPMSWYKQGGNAWLLFDKGTPPPAEKERIKDWLKRGLRGFRQWWDVIVLNDSMRLEEIGSDPKSGATGEITRGATELLFALRYAR